MSSLARSLVFAIALVCGVTACSPDNAQTQFDRGMAFEKGDGVPKDAAQAVAWFRNAAEQGLAAAAQLALGQSYASGHGVPQDAAQAVIWYRKAAEQGHADAQSALGQSYATGQGVPQDYQQAYAWYSVAAANGFAYAVTNRDISAQLSPTLLAKAQALATRYFEYCRPK